MQNLPAGGTPPVSEAHPDAPDIPKIRELTGAILVTVKNYTLYPEDHAICRKSVLALHARLDAFLAEHGVLHLDVREDSFLCEGNFVHQGMPQKDYLPFQLFRDGIQWLEFHSGLTEAELSTFLKLVIQYRTLMEEAEGDLVTALWEADFPHLSYKNEEVLWKAEPLIDFSRFKSGPGETRAMDEVEREPPAPVLKIAIPVADPAFWKLTPEEKETLRDMILAEEMRDYTEDALEVLTIILKEQRDPENFAVILNFLAEEFEYALAQGEFHFVRKFLEGLDALQESVASRDPWTVALLDDFWKKIADPEVMGVLEQAWPAVGIMGADRREDLRQALLLFPADVILILGPMLAKVDIPIIEKLLKEVIDVHARQDLQPLAHLLSMAEESLARKLVPLLKNMDGQGPNDLLFSLTRNVSNAVCRDAIHSLIARDPQNLRKLFPLIDEPRSPIRSLILEYMGKGRNLLAEELLLHYFEKNRNRLKDKQHIQACYRALGRCGSARSLPFLQNTLLRRDWKAFLGVGNSVHRLGAAVALMAMPKEEAAKAMLESAARSYFSGIRAAYRQAIKERKQGKEAGR